jgi:hypothetical protein
MQIHFGRISGMSKRNSAHPIVNLRYFLMFCDMARAPVSKSSLICSQVDPIACCRNERLMGNSDRSNPSHRPVGPTGPLSPAALQRVASETTVPAQSIEREGELRSRLEMKLEAPERWDGMS